MASQDSELVWQSFFDQHQTLVSLLDIHASLLVEMRKHCADSSQTLDLIQTRLLTTENIIATLKESTESLRDTTNRDEVISKAKHSPPASAPFPHVHTSSEPLSDPSGLFRVDTNPTPIEQLFRETSIRGSNLNNNPKRKIVDQEFLGENNDGNESRRKKARPSDQEHSFDLDDSFTREVDAKVRAKEERKKIRQEKKRKRQSDSSINAPNKRPMNKKQKQRHESKASASAHKPSEISQSQSGKRSYTDPSPGGKQNGQPNKKRKKSKA